MRFERPGAVTLAGLTKWASDLVDQLNRLRDARPGIDVLDQVSDGTTSRIRIRASRATQKVRVQVQSTEAAKGGGQWHATDYVSRTDYSAGGWIDIAVVRDGVHQYYVFVSPIVVDRPSSAEKVYDGQVASDLIRRADLGL